MKTQFILRLVFLGLCTDVYGATCVKVDCPSYSVATEGPNSGCPVSSTCYQTVGSGTIRKIQTCSFCSSGYTLVSHNVTLECTDLTYHTCECTNGCIEQDWTTITTGYQRKTTCPKCVATYQYRCASGYYGTTSNGTSGCSPCPSISNAGPRSDAGSNDTITSCYLPNGSRPQDGTGTFVLSDDCYYVL